MYQNETEIAHVIKTPDDLVSYRYPEISEFGFNNIKLWSDRSDLCVLPITDSANFGVWFNLTGLKIIWFGFIPTARNS